METKVVHVHLFEPFDGEHDHYFGSIKAIYDKIPSERIGIKWLSLTNTIRTVCRYENKKCIIKVARLQRTKVKNKS